jgi:hypothetical protein
MDRTPPKKAQAQGFGESKKFGGGGQTPDRSQETVNGEPLPRNCWDSFPYSLTDQGKAEAAAERRALPVDFSRDRTDYSALTSEDKKLDKYRDDLAGANGELQIVSDPMQALMQRYTPVGHKGLFMGKAKTDQSGMLRGILQYEPVLIDDPERPGQKKRVECGGMFLASVPAHLAVAADKHYEAINKAKQVSTMERVQEQSERIMGENGLKDIARRRRTSEDISGLQQDDPEQAYGELLAHESA